MNTPIKTFHFGPDSNHALLVLVDAYMASTALIQASASILEREGFDLGPLRETVRRGDRALVTLIRYELAP